MAITIKGMAMIKNSINKSNEYCLFHQSPTTTVRLLFDTTSPPGRGGGGSGWGG